MKRTWQLQEAKNRFSEVVKRALRHGPQVVTKRGHEVVIVLAVEAYRELTRPRTSLVRFLQESPLAGVTLDVERSKDTGREVEL